MLVDKYSTLIEMATALGIADLSIDENEEKLRISGLAANPEERQQLLDEQERIDPGCNAGDLVLEIKNAGSDAETTYTVRSGDTLSGIGAKYGVGWQDIFEANRNILDDPDLIQPGQELTIP